MLADPKLVYYNAEVMAQRWREEQEWRLNQEGTAAQVSCRSCSSCLLSPRHLR